MEPSTPTPSVEPINQPTSSPTTDALPTPIETPSMNKGGSLFGGIDEFKIVHIFTMACLISASVYSINFHRKMLNKQT